MNAPEAGSLSSEGDDSGVRLPNSVHAKVETKGSFLPLPAPRILKSGIACLPLVIFGFLVIS